MLYRLLNKISRKIHGKPLRTKKKEINWKPLAGLTLSSALVKLCGFVLIQWPEEDKKI